MEMRSGFHRSNDNLAKAQNDDANDHGLNIQGLPKNDRSRFQIHQISFGGGSGFYHAKFQSICSSQSEATQLETTTTKSAEKHENIQIRPHQINNLYFQVIIIFFQPGGLEGVGKFDGFQLCMANMVKAIWRYCSCGSKKWMEMNQ